MISTCSTALGRAAPGGAQLVAYHLSFLDTRKEGVAGFMLKKIAELFEDRIFCLPFSIPPETQRELISWHRGRFLDSLDESNDQSKYSRKTPSGRLIQEISVLFAPKERRYLPPGDFWREQVSTWIKDEVSLKIQNLLLPVMDIFECLNTVEIRTTTECDFLPHYDGSLNLQSQRPQGFHGLYWNLCIPLSENPELEAEDPAFYIIENERKYNLSSNQHYYLFDKTKILHGVDGRDYMRGILHVTGILNPSCFGRRIKTAMSCKKTSTLTEAFGGNYQRSDWYVGLNSEERAENIAMQQKKNWLHTY